MQRVHRKFGSFKPRTADETKVGALLKDFEDAEQMLGELVDTTEQWRNAWNGILNHQLLMITEFNLLYTPIIATGEHSTPHHAETPQHITDRTAALCAAYTDLQADMKSEVQAVDTRITTPAKEARECLKPLKKVLKKREDRKLDYERYRSRVASLDKKAKRSDRENATLAKQEMELERTTAEYQDADQHLRHVLPPILNATFSLLPHLLAAQIEIQNTLLGHLYTVLNEYADQHQFPNPPPELQDVIGPWDAEFTPFRRELESGYAMIAKGKAVQVPMGHQTGSTLTGLGIRNKISDRRTISSSTSASNASEQRRLAAPRYEEEQHAENGRPRISNATKPRIGYLSTPHHEEHSRTPSPGADSYALSRTSTASSTSQSDYFAQQQRPRISSRPSASSLASSPASSTAPGISIGIGKKKPPPPPPPPKKIGSFQGEFVTAMYDYEGQSQGDLSFSTGDRIRVLKKTQSSHDWWEGEVRGVRGQFPANYCR
ncbi:hypothetical protein EJ05DRAFT_496366 [Pseudovirgaria hyperparasitica]|uniref:SH3 domain signaling protein n=1 Tax=Pseudovirgaria hyperparasitica TaxID=470096 RepID=A0A6A6WNC8_9PEZI|nr:uncharacterized protein EJ05DRAFT_496366 [Pseudovirgaria hyperparasitica]KAF2763549.1 hypothetical protein EJ05DRAFT_496366 [Pseudovirgaria hyperparasitica]